VGKSDDSPYSAALAKHVSAEGCQFVFNEKRVAPGQRFRFKLEGFNPVIGTVRWVVTDRVGFAFDRPLSRVGVGERRSRSTSSSIRDKRGRAEASPVSLSRRFSGDCRSGPRGS